MHLKANCLKNSKKAQAVLSYGLKQSKYCIDQLLKNHLAYLNFNAIFEFLG